MEAIFFSHFRKYTTFHNAPLPTTPLYCRHFATTVSEIFDLVLGSAE